MPADPHCLSIAVLHGAEDAAAARARASHPGEEVRQGWCQVRGRIWLQVKPIVAEQGFGYSALNPNRDQCPPLLGPSISGVSLEGAGRLTGFQGDELAHQSDGIVAPAAVGLTP